MLVAACLLPAPAWACSMVWRPFSHEVRNTGRNTWAVRADATVQFDRYEASGLRGMLRLDNIHCYRKPRRVDCPRSLTIPFEQEFNGSDCESTMWRPPLGRPYPRLRYFILSRYDDGLWRIGTAYEPYWRE